MNKRYLTLLYLLLNIGVIVGIGILDPEVKDIGLLFHRINPLWMSAAFFSMLMFWFMDAMVIRYVVASVLGIRLFFQSVRISLIGKYYNAITPFASGGQPCQLYYMVQSGIPAGKAGSILIIKFCIYQLVISFYSVIAIISKGSFIKSYSYLLFWAAIVGFAINAGGLLLIFALSARQGIVGKIVFFVLTILNRIKIIKDLDKAKRKLLDHVNDFHSGFALVKGNIKTISVLACMMAVEIASLLSIPYFISRGYGFNRGTWFDMFAVYVFLYLAVSFFPTPGATGASEGGFYILFKLFLPGNAVYVSMLLWRFITYYMIIIAGGIIVLTDSIRGLAGPPRGNC